MLSLTTVPLLGAALLTAKGDADGWKHVTDKRHLIAVESFDKDRVLGSKSLLLSVPV